MPSTVPFDEFDWRLAPTTAVLEAIMAAIAEIEGRFAKLNEQCQTDLGIELIDNLLRLAFVAAQAYISGTVSDARRKTKAASGFTKHELLRTGASTIPGSRTTQIELIDAVANYYKHHDEWPEWSTPGPHKKTRDVLRSLGANETQPFLCIMAAEAIHAGNKGSELTTLLSVITEWRKAVINHVKSLPT